MLTQRFRSSWYILAVAILSWSGTTSSAQVSFQLGLDTLTQADRAAVLTDGSIAIAFLGNDKTLIWIGNSDGEPQSCFSVPASFVPDAFEMIAAPDGGLFLASVSTANSVGSAFTDDTLRVTVRVMAVSASGQVTFSKDITLSSYVFDDIYDGTGRFHMAADGSGLFISLGNGISLAEDFWYLKLSTTGELLWSRSQVGVFNSPGVPEIDLAPTGDGGVYFLLTNNGGATDGMTAGKLGPSGEPVWVEHFAYQNNVITLEVNDIMTRDDGRPLMAGSLIGVGYSYGCIFSPSADGAEVEGHFYGLPDGTDRAFRSVHEFPNGELFAVTRGVGDVFTNLGVLHLGADMDVMGALRTEVVASGQNDNWIQPIMIHELGGKALMAGSLRSVDQVFGYIQYHPAIWKLDVDSLSACMVSEADVPHYAIPDSMLAIEPITNYTLNPLEAQVVEGPLFTTPETLIDVADLCQQLVSVPERTAVVDQIVVYPNPSEAGSTLNIQCARAVRFALFSATGTLVRNIPGASGSNRTVLDHSGLAAGLYSVVAFGKDGQRLAATNVELR